MFGDLLRGAAYLIRGMKLIIQPGIFRYVLIPLLINALLFTLVLLLTIGQFEVLMDWLLGMLPEWLQWLSWLMWLVFALSVLFIIFPLFTLLANIINAPFNSLLAEAVEVHLTGKEVMSGSLSQAIREIPRAAGNELRKLAYFAVRALPLLVLFIVPLVNLAAPWLWMAFGAWLLAMEYSDYPLGNRGLYFIDQRELLRERRALSWGFGAATLLGTSIPLVNLIVIPIAVAGATALWVENKPRELGQLERQT